MRRLIVLVLGCTVLLSIGAPTSAVAARASAIHWTWPTDAPHVIVRPFIAPETPYAAGHRGIDISTESTSVFAPADGVVHFAGFVVDRPVLSIEHPGGLISSFEPVATLLVAGTVVHRGDVIGELQAGHCSSLCLHFGVRLDGGYVSPLKYLGGIPRSVLLPTRSSPPTLELRQSGHFLAGTALFDATHLMSMGLSARADPKAGTALGAGVTNHRARGSSELASRQGRESALAPSSSAHARGCANA